AARARPSDTGQRIAETAFATLRRGHGGGRLPGFVLDCGDRSAFSVPSDFRRGAQEWPAAERRRRSALGAATGSAPAALGATGDDTASPTGRVSPVNPVDARLAFLRPVAGAVLFKSQGADRVEFQGSESPGRSGSLARGQQAFKPRTPHGHDSIESQ